MSDLLTLRSFWPLVAVTLNINHPGPMQHLPLPAQFTGYSGFSNLLKTLKLQEIRERNVIKLMILNKFDK
jgi:hypothetical protein